MGLDVSCFNAPLCFDFSDFIFYTSLWGGVWYGWFLFLLLVGWEPFLAPLAWWSHFLSLGSAYRQSCLLEMLCK